MKVNLKLKDPEAFARAVKEARARIAQTALAVENGFLLAALVPLARAWKATKGGDEVDLSPTRGVGDDVEIDCCVSITVGDVRRAREILDLRGIEWRRKQE